MIVVSDTSPLNYLILIGQVHVLPQLFGKVVVPNAVFVELSADAAPALVRDWLANPPSWFEVVVAPAFVVESRIHQGEAEAIALARGLGAPLLIDDRRGRDTALENGIVPIGTIAVLYRASRAGLVDYACSLTALGETSFYISRTQIESFIELYKQEQALRESSGS